MQLMYRGYAFDDAEVSLQIFRQKLYAPRGSVMAIRHTWIVSGVKIGSSNSDLTTKLTTLEAECSQDGGDLGFFDNGVPTVHSLLSGGTINGVMVMGPVEYPGGNGSIWGSGTEYTNKRTYRIRFQADVLANQSNLIEYHSSITKIGTGGAKIVWQESMSATAQMQQVKAFTKCLLIQSGRSVGYTAPEPPDTPLYGLPFLQSDKTKYTIGSPQRVSRNLSTHYPVSWTYVFESAQPL